MERVEKQDVLVVEDEDLILMMLEDTLSEGGFSVIPARNGVEAISLLETPDNQPVAIITDIRLGDLSGWAVAKHAREKVPQIAVVYVTGDSAMDWPANGVPNSVCIQKPFAPAQILVAIANQLNVDQPPRA